ncbi:MAG TPA: glycine cleavage T C-terminal barrel domain-containing protein [Gemmatimonadaceae bacterium]|jgi:folate-binding protein YgfZ|nr:glycine cleavage T C-terminal barrel domain-containing protein [Gemmatimonadaceae bacterium]
MTVHTALTGGFPSVGDIAGHSVAMHYGDIAAEYAALRRGAMLVDRSARGRSRVEGAKAAELLTGLVTNDVDALTSGQGLYAAALTPKGKIIADLRIFAEGERFLIDAPVRAQAGWMATLRKFVNPRLAPYRDASDTLRQIGVFGVRAREIVSLVLGVDVSTLEAMAPYAHATSERVADALVARVPDAGLEGYEIFLPADAHAELWRALSDAGATPAGLLAWEVARIEAGRPEWGVDMDDNTIPQEANLEELHAISYTKGCYTGQEVVARVHFRGHVNRHLRGLLCGRAEPPPSRAELSDSSGKAVGDVRSSALSPRLGAIALAMVRREVEPGTTVAVRWEGGEATADVTPLPFQL